MRLDPRLEPMTTPTVPTETLGVSLDETVVEELVPAGRDDRRSHGRSPLLEVKGLYTSFKTRHGLVRAVDGIDSKASTAARPWGSSASPAAARA
jgi:hypothetical protein